MPLTGGAPLRGRKQLSSPFNSYFRTDDFLGLLQLGACIMKTTRLLAQLDGQKAAAAVRNQAPAGLRV